MGYQTHQILVKIDDATTATERSRKIRDIATYARSYVEKARNNIYYVRSRGSVTLIEEKLEDFIQKLETIRAMQHYYITTHFERLVSKGFSSLSDFTTECDYGITNDLLQFAKLIHGQWDFLSDFYDIYSDTSKITDELLDKIKANPQNWALVEFDLRW